MSMTAVECLVSNWADELKNSIKKKIRKSVKD